MTAVRGMHAPAVPDATACDACAAHIDEAGLDPQIVGIDGDILLLSL